MVLGKEFEFVKDYVSDLKIGDEIEVQVKQPENDKGQILCRSGGGFRIWLELLFGKREKWRRSDSL